MVTHIEDGGWSGPYVSWAKSFDDSTLLLEKAMASLTLTGLTKHKLTPVSDKDLAYVKMSEAPNLTPQGLKRWATHKAEATRRIVEVNAFMEDWYRENERMPTKNDLKLINPYIEGIMKADDFEFSFSADESERRENEGEVSFKRPSWITAEDTRWDKLTNAEKQQVIAARTQ